jgi:protein-S-isoprenylcysteine O-methyltransferase Ste14
LNAHVDRTATRAPPPSRGRVALLFAAAFGAVGALLFVPAGRLDWVAGWLYLGIVMAFIALDYAYLRRTNPDLIRHRMKIGPGTKTWDKVWMAAFTPVFLGIYVVAGLDAGRYGWSAMPPWLWWPGLGLMLPGTALFGWSMGVNPFFERTVRIQSERAHRVIDTGPYRIVRHPGYLGFFGWALSAPLMLGSWWAFVPAVLSLLAIVVRTAMEDRTLRAELPGYADYARRVRFRLVPGIW